MKKTLLSLSLASVVAAGASAQEPAVPIEVGTVAPDFEIPGATKAGVLDEHIKLSNYRGQTVVLAFFFKARTGG